MFCRETNESNKEPIVSDVHDQISKVLEKLQSNAKNITISRKKVERPPDSITTESSTVCLLNKTEEIDDKTSNEGSHEEHFYCDNDSEDYKPDDMNYSSGDESFESNSDDDEGDDNYKPAKKKNKSKLSTESKHAGNGSQKQNKQSSQKEKVVVVKLTSAPVYICMVCRSKFPSFELLKQHMQNSNECKSVNLTCVCGKVFQKKKSLYQHSLTHKVKEAFVCDKCGKIYTNRFNLENHKSSQHGEYVEEYGSIYKCKICEKQFTNRTDLYSHINEHSNDPVTLLCDTCGKCFRSAERLRAHTRLHLNIRPFNCTYCPKRFRSRLQLTQHLHVHTGIKTFSCGICTKAFAKKEVS